MIQWSQQYYTGLTHQQHTANNHWFNIMLSCLKDDGKLYVPNIGRTFNKQGDEIK